VRVSKESSSELSILLYLEARLPCKPVSLSIRILFRFFSSIQPISCPLLQSSPMHLYKSDYHIHRYSHKII
jgi:hypothetical protein